jgi:hypothetical protein
MGEAKACELVHLLFARFASPLKMTLEQGATTVDNINTIMGRAKDGPNPFDRRPQGNSVDHSQAPSAETSVRGNSPKCKMFPLFPGNGNGSIRAITAGMLRHGEGLAICPCTRRWSPGLYSAGFEDPASEGRRAR